MNWYGNLNTNSILHHVCRNRSENIVRRGQKWLVSTLFGYGNPHKYWEIEQPHDSGL
jgi:hypothetical protein